MANEKLLSIIVPVYNVEKYLNRCLDSILTALAGREDEYEIIIVNDGSLDGCPAICNDYAKKHKHITTLHQENKGKPVAMNVAINKSKSKYITIIDPDDYVNDEFKNALDQLKQNDGVDYFQFGHTDIIYGDEIFSEKISNNRVGKYNSTDKEFFQRNTLCTWSKIVNRNFIEQHNLVYNEQFRKSEDYDMAVLLLIYAKTIYFSEFAYYIYVKERPGSLTTNFTFKNFFFALQISIKNWRLLETTNISESNKQQIKQLITRTLISPVLKSAKYLDNNDYKKVIKEMKNHRYLLSHPTTSKMRIMLFVSKIIGLSMSIKISVYFIK